MRNAEARTSCDSAKASVEFGQSLRKSRALNTRELPVVERVDTFEESPTCGHNVELVDTVAELPFKAEVSTSSVPKKRPRLVSG